MDLQVAENESLPRVEKIDGYRTSDRSERVPTEVGMVRYGLSMGLEGVVESYLCVALFRMGGWFKMADEKHQDEIREIREEGQETTQDEEAQYLVQDL